MRSTERFVALMSGREEAIDLDLGCLLIAAHAHPDNEQDEVVDAGLSELDRLAAACPGETTDDLRRYLFDSLGFRGNRRHYEDPGNSYLDLVIARRVGIPITLAILTIEVARRVGRQLAPIGMPGHFLVGTEDRQYLDAFDSGAVLDEEGCRRRFVDLVGTSAPWSRDLLAPIGAHAVLGRVLANLRKVFAETQDLRALAWVLELRAAIPGVPATERAERASVLSALGRYDEAASELEHLARIEEAGSATSAAARHPSAGAGAARSEAAEDLFAQAARLRAQLN